MEHKEQSLGENYQHDVREATSEERTSIEASHAQSETSIKIPINKYEDLNQLKKGVNVPNQDFTELHRQRTLDGMENRTPQPVMISKNKHAWGKHGIFVRKEVVMRSPSGNIISREEAWDQI